METSQEHDFINKLSEIKNFFVIRNPDHSNYYTIYDKKFSDDFKINVGYYGFLGAKYDKVFITLYINYTKSWHISSAYTTLMYHLEHCSTFPILISLENNMRMNSEYINSYNECLHYLYRVHYVLEIMTNHHTLDHLNEICLDLV